MFNMNNSSPLLPPGWVRIKVSEELEAPLEKRRPLQQLLIYEQQWLHVDARCREKKKKPSFADGVLGFGGVTWVNDVLKLE